MRVEMRRASFQDAADGEREQFTWLYLIGACAVP